PSRHCSSGILCAARHCLARAPLAKGANMQRLRSLSVLLLLPLPLFAHHTASAATAKTSSAIPASVKSSLNEFDAKALAAHTKFLSSDLLEGRGPGTRGDELAMEYIAAQFQAAGLQPAGDNGTYFQKVPLLGIAMDASQSSVSFTKPGAPPIGPLKHLDQFVANDQSQQPASTLDSELVFVGHGVVAPEYKWDDYKGLDTRGKTLVMLVDDPPANAGEPDLFKGKARTYYGRWTYKYEIGGINGAPGLILVHSNETDGDPVSVRR